MARTTMPMTAKTGLRLAGLSLLHLQTFVLAGVEVAHDSITALDADCPQIFLDFQVAIRSADDSCLPVPAVNANGDYSSGLPPTDDISTENQGCVSKSPIGQVYARNFTLDTWDESWTESRGHELMFYSYYYPREQTTVEGKSHAHNWESVVIDTSWPIINNTAGPRTIKNICMSQFTRDFPTYYHCYSQADFQFGQAEKNASDHRPIVFYEHAGGDKSKAHILTPISHTNTSAITGKATATSATTDQPKTEPEELTTFYDYEMPKCVHWDRLPQAVIDTFDSDPWKKLSNVTMPINANNFAEHAMAVMGSRNNHIYLPKGEGGIVIQAAKMRTRMI